METEEETNFRIEWREVYMSSKAQRLDTPVPDSETELWLKWKRIDLLLCQAKEDIAG